MRLVKKIFFPFIIICAIAVTLYLKEEKVVQDKEAWMSASIDQWPDIALINDIHIFDGNKRFRHAGCAFLIDTGKDTLAVSAKHVYMILQSLKLNTISYKNVIRDWRMYPKNKWREQIVVEELINEDSTEIINTNILQSDVLLFTIKKKSKNIKPLRVREGRIRKKEKVYVIGWGENDKGKAKVYEGKYVGSLGEKILIDVKSKANESGFGGAPVIDAKGYLIGIISTNHGKLSKPVSVFYLKELIKEWESKKYPGQNKSRRLF